MSQLSIVSLIVGGAIVALFTPAVLFPEAARKWCGAFPRSVVAAWVLTAVTLAWSAALLYSSPMIAGIPWAQRLAVLLAPVAFILAIFLLDELLAARSLGGLLVLIPRHILDSAMVHDSPWKLAMTLLAYVMVIAGIILILSPFRFRQTAEILMQNNARSRLIGSVGVIVGIVAVVQALTVY
ncbi:MAG: DUF2065 family protein [bacterium]